MASSSLTKLKRLSDELSSVGQNQSSNSSRVNHSQFGKNVVLYLYTDGLITGTVKKDQRFVFPVNPEEFSVSRNERVQVVQTLGEPFIDEFGKGMPTLTVRGTTGWRIRPTIENIDGHEAFRRLHRNFIDGYFDQRQAKVGAGLNPDDVMLVVVNNVDDLSYKVVPQNFKLLRSRVKPLLYQYEITFGVLEDLNSIEASKKVEDLVSKPKSRNWLSALTERVTPLVNKLTVFATPVCTAVANFIDTSVGILENAKAGVGDIANFIHGVSSSIELVLDATRDTQAFINDLPLEAILELNELTSVVGEFNCYLKNGLTESWLPDFSGVCGVTDCATTHGIKSGSVADSVSNAVEWVVEMREAAKRNGSATIIGIRHSDENLPNMFEDPSAAIIMESTLDDKLEQLSLIQKTPESAGGLDGVYDAIISTVGDIDMDASLLPDENTTDDLKKISQFKIVTVKENESLQAIAYREYGDSNRWYEIAAANDIVIESANELLVPYTSFTVTGNLYRSTQHIDIGMAVPSNYAVAGVTLVVKDVNGAWQKMQVESVSGSVITFHETFSQNYTGPITVMRMTNLASYGVLDGETFLTAAFSTGSKTLSLDEVKDIYPGYVLFVQGVSEARSYTVVSVNYLEKKVTVTKSSIGFASGAKVQIYNRETSQVHVTPGMQLKIPITSGDQNVPSQSANEIYGTDLENDISGCLVVTDGDFSLISGLANLKQAIEHRILSDYESLIVHPQYGCGLLAIVGAKNTPAIRTLAKAALIDALNREPRLARVSSLNSFSVGDAIKFAIEVQSTDSNTATDLNFVIGGGN